MADESGTFDLDAARQARLEAAGNPAGPSFTFRGEAFRGPPELPYDVLNGVGRLSRDDQDLGAITEVMRELLGADYERFAALRPSLPDLNDLLGYLMGYYGLAPEAKNGVGPPPTPASM